MFSRSAGPIAVLSVVAVLVAACGAAAAPLPSGAPSTPTPAPLPVPSSAPTAAPSASPSPTAALILRVTTEGGFIGAAAGLAALPAVSVYRDGRIITPGAVDAVYPGPLLTPAAIRDVGLAGADAIVAAIRAAGLDRPATGGPGVAGDTGTTVFSVTLDGATTVTRFAGLGGGPPGPGGPGAGAGDPARTAALDLLAALTDPAHAWGGSAGTTTTLRPTAYRIFVAPGPPPADPAVTAPPIAWPLDVPLAAFGTPAVPDRGIPGLRMGVVGGADAARLGPVLASASQLTAFTSAGRSYTLYARPLLPDEVGG